MPRASREQSAATERRVLDCAAIRFAREGYAAVPLEDIAADAEVTRGAVYHHFGNKAGLFRAVVDLLQERVGDVVGRAADTQDDLWDQLVVGSHAFLDAVNAPTVRRVLLIDAPAVIGWEAWREGDVAHSVRQLEEVLTELEGTGVIRTGSSVAAARMLSGAMNEAALWVAEAKDPGGARTAARAVLDQLLEGLRVG